MLPFKGKSSSAPVPRSRQKARAPKPLTKSRAKRLGIKEVGMVAEGEYVVEEVMDKKMISTADGRIVHYFIKWKGWGPSHNTWEPLAHLDKCLHLVEAFENRVKQGGGKGQGKRGQKKKEATAVGEEEEEETPEAGPSSSEPEPLTDGQMRIKTRIVVENSVYTCWPASMIPVALFCVIEVDQRLCYVVQIETEKKYSGICSENCVIVRAEVFRPLFPQMVIKHYEKRCVFVERAENQQELEELADAALRRKEENDRAMAKKKEEEEVEDEVVLDEDGLPIQVTKGVDQFGLPLDYSASESSSDDEFEDADIAQV